MIINLFTAIPFIGPDLSVWIRGDYVIGDATLNRFFAFHVIAVPLVLVGLVAAHILALHEVGSNNPDGIEIKKHKDPVTHIPLDGIPFHPYYTVKDIVGVVVFLMVFSAMCSSRRIWAVISWNTTTLFLRIRCMTPGTYCSGLVLHAVLRHSARGAADVRLPVPRRGRHGRGGYDPVLPALAGQG